MPPPLLTNADIQTLLEYWERIQSNRPLTVAERARYENWLRIANSRNMTMTPPRAAPPPLSDFEVYSRRTQIENERAFGRVERQYPGLGTAMSDALRNGQVSRFQSLWRLYRVLQILKTGATTVGTWGLLIAASQGGYLGQTPADQAYEMARNIVGEPASFMPGLADFTNDVRRLLSQPIEPTPPPQPTLTPAEAQYLREREYERYAVHHERSWDSIERNIEIQLGNIARLTAYYNEQNPRGRDRDETVLQIWQASERVNQLRWFLADTVAPVPPQSIPQILAPVVPAGAAGALTPVVPAPTGGRQVVSIPKSILPAVVRISQFTYAVTWMDEVVATGQTKSNAKTIAKQQTAMLKRLGDAAAIDGDKLKSALATFLGVAPGLTTPPYPVQ